MNESSVSSPFMKLIREHYGERAVVVKHADTSMVGQLDCSVTTRGRAIWFEFKLWTPPKSWLITDAVPIGDILAQSPTQYAMACRYAKCASLTAYIVWVRKTRKIVLYAVTPEGEIVCVAVEPTTPVMVKKVLSLIEAAVR